MIYLEETFNLLPAHPENLDKFSKFSQEKLVPACERLGARLIAAWTSNVEWFCQVTQIMEFANIEDLKNFRKKSSNDPGWGEYIAELEEFAPERRTRLLEPLGPISPETLHEAIEASQKTPIKVYGLATLEVNPNKMSEFIQGFELGIQNKSPISALIIASWRPIGGSPNEVIDLWKTYSAPKGYQPPDAFIKGFLTPLRDVAPKEHYRGLTILPYSPLK
ncbi:MAG: NIPSNAP family protein [Promethearchaeota archaeon]|jgi:hypothetical protein